MDLPKTLSNPNMKTNYALPFVCLLVLAAGCASNERPARYGYESETIPSPADRAYLPPTDQAEADRVLANVVQRQFERYGALSTLKQGIEVSARNGTVILNGNVPGEQEREMIQAMVENTPGVTSVDNRLRASTSTPLPFNQLDRTLVNRVRQALKEQPRVAAYAPNLDITADRGVVTLNGTVASEGDRQFIEHVVENTTGVAGVIDQIQAPRFPTGRESTSRAYSGDAGEVFNLHVQGLTDSDRVIAQRILQGLRTDAVLSTLLPRVDIHVADGKVTLEGTAQSEEQRQTIVSTVRRAAGAGNVIDELRVREPR
jgi:osmotically-inducible protein OsmY